MEILIVSDTHGRKDNLLKLLRSHPNTRYLLFCGDGIADLASVKSAFPDLITVAVCGNCDRLFFEVPSEETLRIGGIKILLMHGHLYGVKGGIGAALSRVKEVDADILLYGHTHIPFEKTLSLGERNVTVFNPGSLAERGLDGYSYGTLEIRENGFLLSHGALK